MLLLLLVAIDKETLVELLVGLIGCHVDADIARVHVVQSCCVKVLELEDHNGGSRSF
jgi:hypothetical protein